MADPHPLQRSCLSEESEKEGIASAQVRSPKTKPEICLERAYLF